MAGILIDQNGNIGGRYRYYKEKIGYVWVDYDIDSLPGVDDSRLKYDSASGTVVYKLEAEITKKCNEVDEERDRRISQGMTYTFPDGQTGTVQTRNDTDIKNIQGRAAKGLRLEIAGDGTTTIPFWDAENVTHNLTGAEMADLGDTVGDWREAHYSVARSHKDAIKALSTVDDVANYDYSTGWPA